jgi:hypothetical protein
MGLGTLASAHCNVSVVIFSPGTDIARSDSGYCSKVEDWILPLVSTYIRRTELYNDEPPFRSPVQTLGPCTSKYTLKVPRGNGKLTLE